MIIQRFLILPEILFRRRGRPAPEPVVCVLSQVAHARRGPQALIGRALRRESGARALIACFMTTEVDPVINLCYQVLVTAGPGAISIYCT